MVPDELARIFSRDLTRLAQQLRAFPDSAALWQTVPGVSNAAGTLALHLEGNLREFIGRVMGGVAYVRDRPAEFQTRGVPADELIARIEAVRDLVQRVLAPLTIAALSAPYPGGFLDQPLSTQAVLVHLNGHLNYHVGQIDYLRRQLTGDGAIALAGLPTPGSPAAGA
jgi:hypothetical protein